MAETEPDGGRNNNGKPDLPALIEGLLFVTDGPVNLAAIGRALDVPRSRVERGLEDLAALYAGRGLRLQRTNGQVQLVSAPEVADAIERFLGLESETQLSRAALETLSIVAYRQPVTRPEIDEVRGVNSEGVLRTCIARGLVEPLGRRETVGHPFEYATTFSFLEYFGLTCLEDLPPVELLHAPPFTNGNGSGPTSVLGTPVHHADNGAPVNGASASSARGTALAAVATGAERDETTRASGGQAGPPDA
jgi:segregation and condensation protein B